MWRKAAMVFLGLLLIGVAVMAGPVEVYVQVLDSETGFGEYRWYNEDFGWLHEIPRDVTRHDLLEATLTIDAYDVDLSDEVDLVYADGGLLGPLQGWDDTWFATSFDLDDLDALLGDGLLNVFLDVDATHNWSKWAVTIGKSTLEVLYRKVNPKLRIVSLDLPAGGGGAVGKPGGRVEIVIGNLGTERYVGPCVIDAGLAYSKLWVPEWCTVFDTYDVGMIDLMPGETLKVRFDLDAVPEATYELFRERLDTIWTGYEDTDPDDYVGFVVQFDWPLPPQVDYGPLN